MQIYKYKASQKKRVALLYESLILIQNNNYFTNNF